MAKELWDSDNVKKEVISFCSDLDNKTKEAYDTLLIPYEIIVDIVYAKQLFRQGFIEHDELEAICEGLNALSAKYREGKLKVGNYEDVHSLVEGELQKMKGDLAGNLYLGKSRNDQSATIMRMYMRNEINAIGASLEGFNHTLENESDKNGQKIIPGYTHHRIAMPSTYENLLLSYTKKLQRDNKKIKFWQEQHNECPLGAAAGFGSPLKLDREGLARRLCFDRVSESTLDSVERGEAERDFVYTGASIFNHLSLIAQDLIYLSSEGINVIDLPKEYCTGSSIMPQKRNPDVLEIIKGKAKKMTSRSYFLSSLNSGNISGYNREMQLSKYEVMDAAGDFKGVFEFLGGFVKGIKINEEQSKKLLKKANAYSAEKVIKECAEKHKNFRKEKLKEEKRIKK